jgi:outer membrane protein assembly factor BamB
MSARVVPVAIVLALGPGSPRAADWLQFGVDPAHSGCNRAERGYSTAAGNRLAFPPVALPEPVDVAPVFLEGVVTPSGVRDLLFVVAKNGTVIALDAADGSVVWSHRPTGSGTLTTSAPAIDPERQHVYAYGLDGKVHRYAVGDGSETLAGGWPQVVTLKPDVDKVAAALTIATAANAKAHLYAVTNSYFDTGDYQGSVTSVDLSTGAQRVFNAQCSDLTIHFVKDGVTNGAGQNDCPKILSQLPGQTANSGIWGRPGAVYDAAIDRVFATTGNGLFDPNNDFNTGRDWGDSVLALNPDGTGAGSGMPLDSYTPVDDASLLQHDADLGSTSLAILPAPAGSAIAHLGLQGGKDACVRLLDLDDFSGMSGPGHVGGELQALALPDSVDHCTDGGSAYNFLTQPAVWVDPGDASTWTIIAHANGIVAYRVVIDAGGNPSLSPQWSSPNAGTSAVVANGTAYYVATNMVRALDATTGSPVWSDDEIGSIHWQSPIVVNGRLYVIDQTSKLWVYLLDGVFRGNFD